MTPKVYVLESRRKNRRGVWQAERADCGWCAFTRIHQLFREYRETNPHYEWRVRAYPAPPEDV